MFDNFIYAANNFIFFVLYGYRNYLPLYLSKNVKAFDATFTLSVFPLLRLWVGLGPPAESLLKS